MKILFPFEEELLHQISLLGDYWKFSLICGAIFLFLEIFSRILASALFSKFLTSDKSKVDFAERIVSQVHALSLLFGAGRVVYHLKDHGLVLPSLIFSFISDSNSSLPKDIISSSQEKELVKLSLLYISFSVGYFIWDLSGCIRDFKRLGLAFTIHALCGVFGLGLSLFEPFKAGVMYYACGVFLFELSTPFLNSRSFLYTFGYGTSTLYLLNNVTFALSFLVSRIVWGVPLCLSMAVYVFHQNLEAHEKAMWIASPLISACLNIMWFSSIVSVITRGGEAKTPSPKKKKKDQ